MGFRAIGAALLLSVLPGAGCGTVVNLVTKTPDGAKTPFGGVQQDVSCLHKAANGELAFGAHPKADSESDSAQHPQVAPLLAIAVDLPFTLLGDVVSWPYVVSYNFINQPVPVPPVIHPTAGGPPPMNGAPENKYPEDKKPEDKKEDKKPEDKKPEDKKPDDKKPEKKTPEKDADQGKPKDDSSIQLPLPLPQRTPTP
jgi:hypothetical protein